MGVTGSIALSLAVALLLALSPGLVFRSLRTHPTTEERVRRLRDLRPERTPDAWGGYSFEPPSFPHVRLRQRPRGGWWGYWY